MQTGKYLWFYLPNEYKMPSRDYTQIHEGIGTVRASSCLFLPLAREQQVVPTGFQECSAEIGEYFLQNIGPQHFLIAILRLQPGSSAGNTPQHLKFLLT